MNAFPRIPIRYLLDATAEAPAPPSCPDFGFPSVPDPRRDTCAFPYIQTYDAPCTPEAIDCLLFRRRHYDWRRSRLVALLHRRPPPDTAAQGKFDWCVDVLKLCADMADDTNVVHAFLHGFDVPNHFEGTRAYLRTIRPTHGGVEVPLMFAELWLLGSGEDIPARHSALGYHVLAHLGERVDRDLGAYLWMPPGRTRGYVLEHTRVQHALEKPRPVPTTARTRSMPARDLSLHIFEAAPNPGDFLVGRMERATGGAPCLFVAPSARECFHYERFTVAIAGAEATMDLLAAHAQDWIEAPFDAVLNAGYQRYLTYLLPYAEAGQLGLTSEEMQEQILTAERREAQAWSGTVIGGVAAVATAMNPAIGAIIGVIGLVLQLVLEFIPLAYGGGDCPRLGFRRMLSDPDCAVPTPQGNTDIASLLQNYKTRVAFRPEPSATDGAGQGDAGDELDREDEDGGVPVVPLLGAAAAVAIGLGLLAKRQRDRRQARRTADDDEADMEDRT